MKTITLCCLLVVITLQVAAQNQKNKYAEAAKALQKNYLEMLKNPDPFGVNKKKELADCEAFPLLDQFAKTDLLPKTKNFEAYFKNILEDYNKKLAQLKDNSILKHSSNPNESYLAAVNRSKRFKNFAEDVTGKNILDINKKDKGILLDFYVNHPLRKPLSVSTKGEKIATAKFAECYATTEHILEVSKWNYPKLTWKITTIVTITCDCVDDYNFKEVNEAIFEYDAFVKGTFTTSKIEFEKTQAASLALKKVSCCPEKEEPHEEASISEPSEAFVSLPGQTLGVSAGFGFEQDFEEVRFCLGAEYLYNITELANSPLYVGAVGKISTSSFMDNSAFRFLVGPTTQLFTPISKNNDTQMTNGLSTLLVLGSNDNNGIKNTISGYQIILNTGLNVQINDAISLSLVLPVFSHQNLKFTSQEGNFSSEESATTLLINKNNPVTIGLRFGI